MTRSAADAPRPDTTGALQVRSRLGYLDWLRGIAVLIMIEAHTIDSWTRPADRSHALFGKAMILGGFGAPLFLLLAGVAVGLAAGSKARKAGSDGAGAAAVRRRGWEIFGLAFLFRLQAFLLSGGQGLRALLKVDILNIMGLSLVAAATMWGLCCTTAQRVSAFALATVAFAMLTPIIRATPVLAPLPDPIEAYLRPSPGLTNFTLFPWAGFLFAGSAVGVLVDRARHAAFERQLQIGLALCGAAAALGGYAASYLPSIYTQSNFWTSSPTFFFLRLGVLILAVPAAYVWERRPTGDRWSPLQQFGRTSLFIYWIHIEMVYGVLSAPLHRRLPLGTAIVGLVVFAVFLFGLSLLKNWAVRLWRGRHESPGGRGSVAIR